MDILGTMIAVVAALIVNAVAIVALIIGWLFIAVILTDGSWDWLDFWLIIGCIVGAWVGFRIYKEEKARGTFG